VDKQGIEYNQLSTFLMKKCIITIHKVPLAQLEAIRVRLRKKLPRLLKGGSDHLCFTILDVLVDSYIPEVDKMGFVLDKLEDEILERPSKKTVSDIHQFREDALELRNVLTPERDALMVLARGEYPHFKKDTRNYLRDVYDHMVTILNSLDSYRESTAGILSMYFSSMQLQLNEVMKLLTIIATIMLPLTLIASIYGMNLPIPEAAHSLTYPIVIIIMIFIAVVMLFYFKRKQWI
jgi:magnesium transporter